MKTNSIYGLALIVGMVAGIVTMAFHPTGVDPRATEETVAHEMSILVAVHTLALMSIPLLIFGFAGVTMRAGWHRPEALLAFIIYALSAVALMLAGIADGLINAALIPQMTGAIDPKLQAVKAALSYNFQLNQKLAQRYLWSAARWPLFFGQLPFSGLERLSEGLELLAGLSVSFHSPVCSL